MLDGEYHIRDYLKVLKKRRYSVLSFFTVVMVVVVIRTLTTTPVYRATTRALIEKSEPQSLSLVNSYYSRWDPEFYETQIQIIKSPAVGMRVIEKLSPEVQESLNPEIISNNLIVTPVPESKIVTISYRSRDPDLAARIVNTVVRAYIDELLEMRMSESRYSIQWMSEKAEVEKQKLEKSERALQAYMKASDIITLENKLTIVPQKLSELSMQLTRAQTRRKELEALYEKAQAVSDNLEEAEKIPFVEANSTLPAIRLGIFEAEQEIMELSKKYGEKHPRMVAARSELEMLQRNKEREIRRVLSSIENETELAQSSERNLRQLLSATKSEALDINEKFIQFEVLKREVETNRQFFNALMTKTKEQSITEQIQGIHVWTIEEAKVPRIPEVPKKARNILFGLIFGLLGGVSLAFLVEYLDNTVKSPDEAEEKTGVPVLGVIPLMKEGDGVIEEAVLKEPSLPLAESYKALRTSVLLSSASSPPRTILVTSMVAGEGKTVTALNLAVATAMFGHSVLLVDGDLRRPRIHRILELENEDGLSQYLAGISENDIVTETSIPNLKVITPGPTPPNPSELLGSERMDRLVGELREQYDLVIFDSPPILTVTDSLVLSKHPDMVIVVARAEKTTYDMLRRGIKTLSSLGVRSLGLVLNAVDERKSDYYYHYYKDEYYKKAREAV